MRIINIPICRQKKNYTCGAAAVKSILMNFNIDLTEEKIAKILSTDENNGTNPNSIYNFLSKIVFCNKTTNLSIQDIKNCNKKNYAVIVLLQAWGDKINYKNDWEDGHYAIVIGSDEEFIYFMDPSSDNYTFIQKNEFINRWHDKTESQKLKHFGLIVCHDFSTIDIATNDFVEMK
jgi:predicted double-glycine peptidase